MARQAPSLQRLLRPWDSDEKNAHLKNLDNASEKLQLFKVDLLDYDTVAAAVAGCEGVFHVVSPVPSTRSSNPEVELIAPAVEGTLNVLKACFEFKVKRVVVVSSVGAVLMNPNWPEGKVMDEECWSDYDYCRTILQYWYPLSKTIAESTALDYAAKHGLDVVTVLPSMVLGPLLQSTVNTSSLFLISILKGIPESRENVNWHYVDVRDVADALLLVYDKPESSGRYICAPHPINIRDLVDMLKGIYPNYNYPKEFIETHEKLMTSEKLKKLGWKYRPLKDTLVDTVECYEEAGLLNTDVEIYF